MSRVLGNLQQVGKAMMLPIAVMPAAAILLSLGYNMTNPEFVEKGTWIYEVGNVIMAAGNAIFTYLPLLFAIGVAVGMTGGAGAAGLAAVAGYVILNSLVGLDAKPPTDSAWQVKLNQTDVLGGIITGLITAYLYRRYKDIHLPDWLQFFGGKRFVPIITSFVMMIVGILFMVIWPPIRDGIADLGNALVASGGFGLFGYGFLNRLLLPFGLHHILNTLVWFNVGEFTNAAGEVVKGDLQRFFAGDPRAGSFMAGFYPIMMFALPGACLAMVHEAKSSQRKATAGILMAAALTAFVTGITEPIEYAFMFLAPVLYGIHAILTGLSLVIMDVLGVKHGFGFSAGLIDYLLNFTRATKAWLIIPVGLVYTALYYGIFRVVIRKLNLPTPGRIEDGDESEVGEKVARVDRDLDSLAVDVLAAIGGQENVEELDACITRLRMTLRDDEKIDQDQLKKLGSVGVIRVGKGYYQAVFGTQSERLRDRIIRLMGRDEN
ncbi:PTS system N-acetylglucosamine-specific IIB component, Glc family /PTS system N-acetylglucosamine-specific IIC component, Glc family [Marininema mesophilum]|uniref:PTS system N-acetylglucosamine-specific IIB component, Glc family /PTS system N-acetylglucosamine-specific IIC component, Glc family n=1 Tax=Marininema mesophilum TaxID=1048340 RepID=A0A1H2WYZ2_9BACL|nr:PTS transporter subunit EIIC [Marininema mesophilum]SDW85474.1 PTS system N-acetylglucosamine-specific IIB component, Glc family /PTS system N-acetylglucosamine-specific IIC component, Glc family [Marininema mesophilum]